MSSALKARDNRAAIRAAVPRSSPDRPRASCSAGSASAKPAATVTSLSGSFRRGLRCRRRRIKAAPARAALAPTTPAAAPKTGEISRCGSSGAPRPLMVSSVVVGTGPVIAAGICAMTSGAGSAPSAGWLAGAVGTPAPAGATCSVARDASLLAGASTAAGCAGAESAPSDGNCRSKPGQINRGSPRTRRSSSRTPSLTANNSGQRCSSPRRRALIPARLSP